MRASLTKICLSVGLLMISLSTALAMNCDDTSIYPKDMPPARAVSACKEAEKARKSDHGHTVISACIRKYYDDLTVRETEAITRCLQGERAWTCLPFDGKSHDVAAANAATECIVDGVTEQRKPAKGEPVFVDFFKAGVQRTAEYRDNINEMGEAPVLVQGKTRTCCNPY
jgi:hypothetical protein